MQGKIIAYSQRKSIIFRIYKDWIFILPTISVSLNDPQYTYKNFSIEFHFLIFHARLLWMKGKDEERL